MFFYQASYQELYPVSAKWRIKQNLKRVTRNFIESVHFLKWPEIKMHCLWLVLQALRTGNRDWIILSWWCCIFDLLKQKLFLLMMIMELSKASKYFWLPVENFSHNIMKFASDEMIGLSRTWIFRILRISFK